MAMAAAYTHALRVQLRGHADRLHHQRQYGQRRRRRVAARRREHTDRLHHPRQYRPRGRRRRAKTRGAHEHSDRLHHQRQLGLLWNQWRALDTSWGTATLTKCIVSGNTSIQRAAAWPTYGARPTLDQLYRQRQQGHWHPSLEFTFSSGGGCVVVCSARDQGGGGPPPLNVAPAIISGSCKLAQGSVGDNLGPEARKKRGGSGQSADQRHDDADRLYHQRQLRHWQRWRVLTTTCTFQVSVPER